MCRNNIFVVTKTVRVKLLYIIYVPTKVLTLTLYRQKGWSSGPAGTTLESSALDINDIYTV